MGSDSPREGYSSLTPTRSIPVPRMLPSSVSVIREGDVEWRGGEWTIEGFLYGTVTADYINKTCQYHGVAIAERTQQGEKEERGNLGSCCVTYSVSSVPSVLRSTGRLLETALSVLQPEEGIVGDLGRELDAKTTASARVKVRAQNIRRRVVSQSLFPCPLCRGLDDLAGAAHKLRGKE